MQTLAPIRLARYRCEMQVEQLFAVVRAKWPDEIDITKSELSEPDGFLSWDMVRLEEDAQAEAANEDGLIQAAIWPFHQALSDLARSQFTRGAKVVRTKDVRIAEFIRFLMECFEEPGWSEERDVFRRSNPDIHRMADLLRKNRRKRLVPGIVQKWAARGVSASPLSDDRQQKLLGELRAWRHSDYSPLTDLRAAIVGFLDDVSAVVVIDFDVNEEPALLVPVHSLWRSEEDLRSIYPDGFALVREDSALIVDFEEQLGCVNVSNAKAP